MNEENRTINRQKGKDYNDNSRNRAKKVFDSPAVIDWLTEWWTDRQTEQFGFIQTPVPYDKWKKIASRSFSVGWKKKAAIGSKENKTIVSIAFGIE